MPTHPPPDSPHDRPEPPPRRGLRRGAYVLPSLFTMGNILLGFYAVVLGFRGEFERATWMVLFAAILDTLDGRIARLTNTESDFGKEFDSLADVLTFGAAPAYLTFLWGLHDLGRIGWLLPLYFLLCTSIRLARFNVQTKSVDTRYFVGLPSPAAAGSILALFFFVGQAGDVAAYFGTELDGETLHSTLQGLFLVMLGISGSLMISTFRYPSFKRLDLRRKWSYRSALLLAIVLLVLTFHPTIFFEGLALTYLLSGPIGWLWGKLRRRTADAALDEGVSDDDDPDIAPLPAVE